MTVLYHIGKFMIYSMSEFSPNIKYQRQMPKERDSVSGISEAFEVLSHQT